MPTARVRATEAIERESDAAIVVASRLLVLIGTLGAVMLIGAGVASC